MMMNRLSWNNPIICGILYASVNGMNHGNCHGWTWTTKENSTTIFTATYRWPGYSLPQQVMVRVIKKNETDDVLRSSVLF